MNGSKVRLLKKTTTDTYEYHILGVGVLITFVNGVFKEADTQINKGTSPICWTRHHWLRLGKISEEIERLNKEYKKSKTLKEEKTV